MENLTNQEKGILELVVEGLRNKEIARKMNLSIHTVKAHLENIYRRLDVSNRVQVAIIFILAK